MNIEKSAIDILSSDMVSRIDMLQAISRNNAEIIYAEAGAVLLYNISGRVFMFYADDEPCAMRCLEKQKALPFCVGHGDAAITALSKRFGLESGDACLQCAYMKSASPPLDSRFYMRQLTQLDRDFVLEHYQHDPNYIDELLALGIMYGAELKSGALAGFIGMHDEGSLGLLEVAPEYRRMGVATALQSFMIGLSMERGWIPYGQVYLDNDASLSLQKRMGMELSKDIIRWMFIRDDR